MTVTSCLGLDTDARTLLVEASRDRNGTVLTTQTFGGLSVETNGRDFVDQKREARTEARWRRAVREPAASGLLEERDREGQVFSVTDHGFQNRRSIGAGAAIGDVNGRSAASRSYGELIEL